jgi:hypothetical protein
VACGQAEACAGQKMFMREGGGIVIELWLAQAEACATLCL